jgi:hypothetical protein
MRPMNPQQALEMVRQRERELQQRAERDRRGRAAGKCAAIRREAQRPRVIRFVLRRLRWTRG